ncbi:MAG: hypothetical protein K6T83_07505 [Alicyclobacillus sp.]|nr:hypothetical protein [Alicyclobacillus sp.]
MADFPKVPWLRGELKRSEIRAGVRYQLTTQEFVLQRESRTYRIALDNILGVIECDDTEYRAHAFQADRGSGKPYKIVATLLHLVSPSGVIEQAQVSFYTRLSNPFARYLEGLLHQRATP